MLGEGANTLPSPTGVVQTNTVSHSGTLLLTTGVTAPAYAGSGSESTAFTSKGQLAAQKTNGHKRRCHKIQTKVGRAKTLVKLPKTEQTQLKLLQKVVIYTCDGRRSTHTALINTGKLQRKAGTSCTNYSQL